MAKYRKKPVVIEAIELTRTNLAEVDKFVDVPHITDPSKGEIIIPTLEGNMAATIGDYIIRGVQGEFYPCKPDIFEQTYEKEK